MITNANEILFRASSWGNLITNDRSGKDMGQTAKKECIKIFAQYRYGRREEIKSKFLTKGNEREEDAITLLSRVTKTVYKKNKVELRNQFFSGTLDLYLGESITKADETNDTKCSWSLLTYLEAQTKCEAEDVTKGYYWQGQTYMNLTGAKRHTISYCLVNGTHKFMNDELRKLQWELGVIDPDNITDDEVRVKFEEKAKQLERNHIFDREHFEKENPGYNFITSSEEWKTNGYDIPLKDRLTQISFDRSEEDIQRMIGRALLCRTWINKNLFKL